jgi:hypothetical protein
MGAMDNIEMAFSSFLLSQDALGIFLAFLQIMSRPPRCPWDTETWLRWSVSAFGGILQ